MLSSADSWALFFHLLGAFLFVGGVIVAGIAFEAAQRRHRPGEIALLLGLTRIGVLLVAVGAPVVLPFGLWLVHLGRFGYRAGWVDAALALLVVVLVLGAIGGQRPKRARASWRRGSRARSSRRARSCGRCSTTAARGRSTTSRPCSCSSSWC